MSNVIMFDGITSLDRNPDLILEEAKGMLDSVVILGYGKDGEQYINTSIADGGDMLWLLEQVKLKLLTIGDALDDE